MLRVFVFAFLLVACAHAFSPRGWRVAAKSQMVMKKEFSPIKFAVPATLTSILAPAAAFAAEGTSRAFGIDDGRLVWAALLPSFIIFPLYLQWSSQQEGEDFFDGYEKRRNG